LSVDEKKWLRNFFLAFIVSPPFSNVGCWELIRVPSAETISTTYLDQFTFRFNRRTSKHRGKLFYRLIQQVVLVDPVTWKNIAQQNSTNLS
jgi:hypothetical protein